MKKLISFLIVDLLFLSVISVAWAVSYSNVTVTVAKSMIDSDPSLVILDVRDQSEYNSGHIRNAKLIPSTELLGRLNELSKTDRILVYCAGGGRSAAASQILVDHDFLYVYNMLGGISSWIALGYPVYVKYSSLQHTINVASEGQSLYISSGTYFEHVVVNKTISLIGENREATIVNGAGSTVLHIEASNVTIDGFTIQGASAPNDGIEMEYLTSSHGKIVNNIIRNNSGHGLDVVGDSNIISGNLITNNAFAYSGYCGINTYYSSNNTIYNNIISDNAGHGIALGLGSSNLVKANRIVNNGFGHLPSYEHAGLAIGQDASGNTIIENTIEENQQGIWLAGSDNEIYHNNFINNTHQTYRDQNPFDIWDDGYEGNYWTDYNGSDINGDGIGDTPYIIDSNNTDHYPLMNPYWRGRVADVNHDLKVDILDVVRICATYGSTPSDPYWDPDADIAEPLGKIDILDVVLCTSHYGEKSP